MAILALSDAVAVGIIGLAGVTVTAVAAVIAALVTRGQSKTVGKAVDDFEGRYKERGDLLEAVIAREERCFERLGAAEARIAALEQRETPRG